MSFAIDEQFHSYSPHTEQKPPVAQSANEKPLHMSEEVENTDDKTFQEYQVSTKEEQSPSPPQEGCTKFLSLDFYEKFFQVSQDQVIERIKMSFMPTKKQFIQKASNPDFYGPFWILTTIIFLLGSTGNLSRYFYNWDKSEYIFKLQLVRYGVILLYTFGFGVPVILYFVLKFLKCTTLALPQLICIYGYSFSCFILVFILCILPFSWLQWLLMIYGMINSIAFLVRNLKEYLESLDKKSYIIFGIIGGAQIFLFLMFKLVFFDLIYDSAQ